MARKETLFLKHGHDAAPKRKGQTIVFRLWRSTTVAFHQVVVRSSNTPPTTIFEKTFPISKDNLS